jgi:hypothetical protein
MTVTVKWSQMNTYLEQLETMEEDKRKAVCKALLDTMYAITYQLGGLADNHPVFVKELDENSNPNNTDFVWSRLMCLKWLDEGAKIIDLKHMEDFQYVAAESNGHDYMVTIINRYAFEELLLTLQKIDARLSDYHGYDVSIEDETVPNLAYYDLDSGRGIVNGHVVKLTGRNKKLFNALFLAAPNTIDRATVERIAKIGHKDDPIKYAVNDAFSAVRKACGGINNTVIIQVGGYRLNAKVFPLSFQLFQNTYSKQQILPKKLPK